MLARSASLLARRSAVRAAAAQPRFFSESHDDFAPKKKAVDTPDDVHAQIEGVGDFGRPAIVTTNRLVTRTLHSL
jgi:hypothetical protein